MSPTTGIGVYPYAEVGDAIENDEVSSTYEGRHLTFTADQITGREAAHALVQKGHPVVIGEHIVGVAFMTEVLGTDLIPIDTEGIWVLSVVATDQDAGGNAVVAGDELFINKTNAIISKNNNKVTHTRFGYALGGVVASGTGLISVKVHWNDDDEEELVGQSGTEFLSADASHRFREHHYEATGGGYPKGDFLALTVHTTKCTGVQALRRELHLPGDEDGSASSYVGEFDLHISAGAVQQRTMACLKLNFINLNTSAMANYAGAYIQLSDDTASAYTMRRLLNFIDIAAIPDAGVDPDLILVDTNTDHNMNAAIRCGYGAAANPFWIMCTTTQPD